MEFLHGLLSTLYCTKLRWEFITWKCICFCTTVYQRDIEAEIEILICTYIFKSNVLSISFDDFLTKFECWFFFFIIFLLLLKTVKTLFLLVRKKHFELQNLFSFSVLKSPSPTFTSLNLSCFALDIYFFNFLGNNTQARENSTQILYGKRNYDNWQGQSSQGFARSGSQKATSTPFKL